MEKKADASNADTVSTQVLYKFLEKLIALSAQYNCFYFLKYCGHSTLISELL